MKVTSNAGLHWFYLSLHCAWSKKLKCQFINWWDMKEKNNGELVIHVIFAIGIHTPHSTTLGSHWLLNIFSVFYPFGLAIHSSQMGITQGLKTKWLSFPFLFYLPCWLTFAVTAKKEMELIAMLVTLKWFKLSFQDQLHCFNWCSFA